jgi:hypothetical protein
MSIKEEVLKEIADLHSMDFIEIVLDVPRAIDLTQQKMIKEFKEMIDKRIKRIHGDYFYVTAEMELEELKSQVEKGK